MAVDKPADRLVQKVTSDDGLAWWQRGDQRIRLADALDAAHGAAMTVGFARYAAGESNEWRVNYDEALVVTKGRFSVRTANGTVTASAGEVIYLWTGAPVVYQAEEETELVYVTHPHWMAATDPERLAEFQPSHS